MPLRLYSTAAHALTEWTVAALGGGRSACSQLGLEAHMDMKVLSAAQGWETAICFRGVPRFYAPTHCKRVPYTVPSHASIACND
jgi:hypothetical protein